jgi:DNA-binding beta-propeller fold protein YncE
VGRSVRWTVFVGALLIPACGGGGGGGGGGASGGGGGPGPGVSGFLPILPRDGETGVGIQPRFTWNAHPAATSYTLELSTASDFSSLVFQQTFLQGVTSGSSQFLTPGATYWWRVFAVTPGGPVLAQGSPRQFIVEIARDTLTAISGTLRDLVYDPVRNRVYASNEQNNRIEVLQAGGGGLLAPIPVGSKPWGLDLSADSNTLLVCNSGEDRLALIDLTSNPPAVSYVTVPADLYGNTWPRSVGSAANGRVFFTTTQASATWCQVREINVSTSAISVRSDAPPAFDLTYVAASLDRSRLMVASQSGAYFLYDSASDAFSATGAGLSTVAAASANSDGSRFALPKLLATSLIWLSVVDPNLRVRAGLRSESAASSDPDAGFVFAPAAARGYRAMVGQPCLELIDTDRWQPLDLVPTSVPVTGDLSINSSGAAVFAIAQGGILEVDVSANRAPVFESLEAFTLNSGQSAGLVVRAVDPEGSSLAYAAQSLPAGATFDPATRQLLFAAGPADVGVPTGAVISASDGIRVSYTGVVFLTSGLPSYAARTIPMTGQLHDVVGDPVRGRIYATNFRRNRVEVVDAATGVKLDPIDVGSAPRGIDLDSASGKMVVCTSMSEYLQVIDLTAASPAVTTLAVPGFAPFSSIRFPYSVAAAANGKAVFTYWLPNGTGTSRPADLDLSTNTFGVRADAGSVDAPSLLRSGADRSALFLGQDDVASPPNGPNLYYRSSTDSFVAGATTDYDVTSVDVNGDGSLFLAGPGPHLYQFNGTNLILVRTYSGAFEHAAFRQGAPVLYRSIPPNQIEVLDANSSASLGTFSQPDVFYGPMRTDASGSRLFFPTRRGLTIVELP